MERGIWAVLLAALLSGSYQYVNRYVTISSNVNGRELPICSVEREDRKIALTFDETWGSKNTGEILDILDRQNVRATFFMTGDWVEKYPEDVQAIQRGGHDLGNHTENHKTMTELTEEMQKEEIQAVHQKVENLTGVKMDLLRLPYGEYDDTVIRSVQACGYYPIQWSVDSMDWKEYGKDSIIDTVLDSKDLKEGAIILLHSDAKYTAQALEELIGRLKEQGYELVPVSELIYTENYYMDVTGRQHQD